MSFICHIHNYTEYNQQWNVFSAFNPSKWTHTWSSGQPTLRHPGSSWGFGALLKGLTSVIDNSCRSQDSNPHPQITSPTLYPLGHDCPNYVPLPFFFCLRQADLLTMHLSFFLNTAPWQQAWRPIREKKHASLVYFQNCITCFSHFNHMQPLPPFHVIIMRYVVVDVMKWHIFRLKDSPEGCQCKR